MMKLAVSGSRTFPRPSFIVDGVLWGLLGDVVGERTLLVGDCPTGADAEATLWAREHDIPTEVFKADWSQGQAAGPLRNRELIKAGPDLLVAFTDKPWTESKGTASTIRYAWAADVPVLICEFHGASKSDFTREDGS